MITSLLHRMKAALLEAGPVFKFDEDQPRDDSGRWTDGGGSSSSSSDSSRDESSGRGTASSKPPVNRWRDPPRPSGKGGRKAGGYSATGRTNTELGTIGERALAKDMDFHNLHPDKNQGKFDLKFDSTNVVFEVKTCSVQSTQYKVKMKENEFAEKRAYAKANKLKAGTMIVVMDSKRGELHAYWKFPLGNYELKPGSRGVTGAKGWNFAGTIKLKGRKSADDEIVVRYSDDQERDESGRWTSGGGASPAAGDAVGGERGEPGSNMAAERAMIETVAKHLGFPPGRIDYSDRPGYQFTVNKQQMQAAGEYDPSTQRITIFAASGGASEGVVAHEISHAQFDEVMRTYRLEEKAALRDPRGILDEAGFVAEEGTPQREIAQREYPVLTAIQPVWEGKFEELKRDDGVSNYSASYWSDSKAQGSAINETLAEIARIHYQTGVIKGGSSMRMLYARIQASYRSIQRRSGRSKKSATPPSGSIVATRYLDAAWELVPPEQAVLVQSRYSNGTVVFSIPVPAESE